MGMGMGMGMGITTGIERRKRLKGRLTMRQRFVQLRWYSTPGTGGSAPVVATVYGEASHSEGQASDMKIIAPRQARPRGALGRWSMAVLAICGFLACTQAEADDVKAGADAAASSADLVARGRYLATAADCAACHTAPGGRPFAGGDAITTPLGTIYSSNITPSAAFGIGGESRDAFAQAVRDGVRKDGAHLYPAMPYTAYSGLSDPDIDALYAYFMHGVSPVDAQPRPTALGFPFNIRASMILWNLMFHKDRRFAADPARSPEYNRGAYLAQALGHCSTCHTPRSWLMAENAARPLAGGSLGSWYAPNITSDATSGVGGWTDADLYQYLRTGHISGKAQAAGPMAEAVQNSLQYLTDPDLKALVTYIKQSPAIASPGVSQPRYAYGLASASEASLRGNVDTDKGWQIFSGSCAACHQANGTGTQNNAYPSLFHNTTTGAERADNLVTTILFGLSRTVDGKTTFMPGFGPQASFTERLSDDEIAAVSNYVLAQYGNPSVKVTAADVVTIRNGGPTPLLARLVPVGLAGSAVVIALVVVWLVRRRRRPSHSDVPRADRA
jgi:mono/diheme cytochrome c family protein